MRSFSGSFSQIGSFAPGGLIRVGRNDRSLVDSRSCCSSRIRFSTFGLVGGSGGFAGGAAFVFTTGIAASLAGFKGADFSGENFSGAVLGAAGFAPILLGRDDLVSTRGADNVFLFFATSLRVALSAGLTEAGLPPEADLVLPEATDPDADDFDRRGVERLLVGLFFDERVLEEWLWAEPFLAATFFAEPALVNPDLVAPPLLPGLEAFDLAAIALLELLVDLPLPADLDLLDMTATAFELEFFFAAGFDEAPLVAGFFTGRFTGFGIDLLLPAFFEADFRDVFFFDALATAFTNHC